MEVGRFKDMSKLGELTKDWRGGGEGCNTCFSYFKNIQFASSRINLLYLGYGALNNRGGGGGRRGKIRCRVKQEITDLDFL